jgi:soluble lytic murein transglycosylase-like protein
MSIVRALPRCQLASVLLAAASAAAAGPPAPRVDRPPMYALALQVPLIKPTLQVQALPSVFRAPRPLPQIDDATGPSAPARETTVDAAIRSAARKFGVDEALIRAVIHVESGFNPKAVSPKGATGLMQLMPDTARRFGVVDASDPAQNIHGGTNYLRVLLDLFKGDLRLALAAYNAGEGAVLKYKRRIPPYEETQDYVQLVLGRYRQLRG